MTKIWRYRGIINCNGNSGRYRSLLNSYAKLSCMYEKKTDIGTKHSILFLVCGSESMISIYIFHYVSLGCMKEKCIKN